MNLSDCQYGLLMCPVWLLQVLMVHRFSLFLYAFINFTDRRQCEQLISQNTLYNEKETQQVIPIHT